MGMFDTVHFNCPRCNEEIEEQSKAGDCTLADYPSSTVPVVIAVDMQGDTIWCTSCNTKFKVYSKVVEHAELKLIEQS